jgi:glycosyltransferase involved in cell wall biosynthesis
MLQQIAAFRLIDLSDAGDRLIAFRPPSYVIQHPHKMLWFIHHIRVFYDLWDTPFGAPHTAENDAIRRSLVELDTRTIGEARKVYTNSKVVSDRLQKFSGIASEPLYPPVFDAERFRHEGYGDEILVVNRVEPHKRPALMIDAMKYVRTPVRLRLCGAGSAEYSSNIERQISEAKLGDRVTFENRWISDEEKIDLYADALAVAYVPIDEDGIGYPTCEAAHSHKPVITATDSGATLEFVTDGENGFVVEPDPVAVAEAMDRLYRDRALAKRLGDANLARLSERGLNWDRVVDAFTA